MKQNRYLPLLASLGQGRKNALSKACLYLWQGRHFVSSDYARDWKLLVKMSRASTTHSIHTFTQNWETAT